MRGSRRCLRRCRARRSTAQYIRFGGFDGIWALWANLNPPGVRFDVEAGASEASGRARISGLIGLLMRPCKAKGVIGLVAIHVEPAYLSVFLLFTFFFFFSILPSSSFRFCKPKRQGAHTSTLTRIRHHGLSRFDTPDSSLPETYLYFSFFSFFLYPFLLLSRKTTFAVYPNLATMLHTCTNSLG